jgi:hypothetical protein
VCKRIGIAPYLTDDSFIGNRDRRSYQTDVTDEEWSFVAPYLALCREGAGQREYSLRSVFNALRYIHCHDGLPLAHAAERSAALASGLSADAPVDERRLFRDDG